MEKIKNKNRKLDSGIDLSLLIDEKNSLVEEATCLICLNLASCPKYCQCCGKIFCEVCIENWLKKSNSCPNCRNNSFDKPPIILMNFLSKIRLKCQYSQCSKLLLYNEFNTHIITCEYGLFQCYADNCSFLGNKYEVYGHISICQNMEQECSDCGTKILKKLLNSHLNVCELKNNSNYGIIYRN